MVAMGYLVRTNNYKEIGGYGEIKLVNSGRKELGSGSGSFVELVVQLAVVGSLSITEGWEN